MNNAGDRPRGPAGGGPTLADVVMAPHRARDHARYPRLYRTAEQGNSPIHPQVCWACGADWRGAPLSGCTEKRNAKPWRHNFLRPGIDHPWRDWPFEDLVAFSEYLRLKAAGSLAAVRAWQAVPGESGAAVDYAVELYSEKAVKRIRLLEWVLRELEWMVEQEARDGRP